MAAPEIVAVATGGPARRRHPLGTWVAAVWLAVTAVGIVSALFGWLGDPLANDYSAISQPPSFAHLFGTDNLGRDVFARAMTGGIASATVALVTVLVGGGVGVILGVWAGVQRGFADALVGFLTDTAIALPGMIVVSTIVTLSGPSLPVISLTIAIFTIPIVARMARAATLTVATENYVTAARMLGASGPRILFREVLPGVLPLTAPYLLTTVAASIVAEGSLSFLGFGLRPPQPSWGGMIAEGRSQLVDAPWVTFFPALLLCATVLAINVLGDRVRGGKK